MSEGDDRMELEARRKGYVQDGVYVKVDVDARVITKELIKPWAPEDLEIIRDRITEAIGDKETVEDLLKQRDGSLRRIAELEAALRQRCDECDHDTDDILCAGCKWYNIDKPSGDGKEHNDYPPEKVNFRPNGEPPLEPPEAPKGCSHDRLDTDGGEGNIEGVICTKCSLYWHVDEKGYLVKSHYTGLRYGSPVAASDKEKHWLQRIACSKCKSKNIRIHVESQTTFCEDCGNVEHCAEENAPAETAGDLKPGLYWVKVKSATRPDLLEKHNMPLYFGAIWKRTENGYWRSLSDPWVFMTIKQFTEFGYLLGPRIEEPEDDQFREMR